MNKKQWAILIIAFLLIAFLISLPKIIIDNDPEELVRDKSVSSDTVISESEKANPHAIDLDSSLVNRIETFKSEYKLAGENKKKSIFADSLARGYLKLRDFDNSIMFAKEALKLNESFENKELLAEIYYEAMTFSLEMEDAEKLGTSSREIMEGLLEEQPDRFDLMNKVAMTYVVSEAPMKGIMMLREVLEKDPDNVDATFNLGILSIQSGQHDKGIERFVKLTEIDPANVRAWYYLGLCLKETGESEKAKDALNKGLSLDPDPEVKASINALLKEF